MTMLRWSAALGLLLALGISAKAGGQDAVILHPPAPVVVESYAPTVSYYAAPTVRYRVPATEVVTYRAPVVSYSAPVVSYRAPVVYQPVVPGTTAVTYRSGLGILRPRYTTIVTYP